MSCVRLSIALVRDFQVVWTAGFGVKNKFTGGSVTLATAFDVASISKVVTAYAALRLVDQGQLSLNAPFASFLEEPWLPPSELGNQITLRHLHTTAQGMPREINRLASEIEREGSDLPTSREPVADPEPKEPFHDHGLHLRPCAYPARARQERWLSA